MVSERIKHELATGEALEVTAVDTRTCNGTTAAEKDNDTSHSTIEA